MIERDDQVAKSASSASPEPLPAEDAARLVEFVRAFKAAARAVQMYPSGHPAIGTTLGRVAELTSAARLPSPLHLTVLPDGLLLDERALARADAAATELAQLLHAHAIGSLEVTAGGDVDSWRAFLLLIGRAPDQLRSDGGIARAWAETAAPHIRLREIDYAQMLREREQGHGAVWKRVIENCLQGQTPDLDEDALRELLEIAMDAEQLAELVKEVETRAAATGGLGARTGAVLRMLRAIVDATAKADPDRVEPVLRNLAGAVAQLTPETIIDLLTSPADPDAPRLMSTVVSRMSDGTIAQFVARNVIDRTTSTDRLAVAFQALVKDREDPQRLIGLAEQQVAESPLGSTDGFDGVWNNIAEKLLTSYSDTSYVSDTYGHELSSAHARAIDLEHVSADPPERVAAWLSTVATTALRALDRELVLDLLRIEDNDDHWTEVVATVERLLEELLLVGDFDYASQLLDAVRVQMHHGDAARREQAAGSAIERLAAGVMMRHIVTHLATMDDAQFAQVKDMLVPLGEVVVRPLAEALSTEERARPRQRLTAILLAFGNVGRRTAERLKSSPNAAVRRTAIYLLREFGGSEALPDLTELLNDSEPNVQREAVRAILNIATQESYSVLEKALVTGSDTSREAIMEALTGIRDERATPVFTYIVQHVNHRGPLVAVYLRAIESLGLLRDPEAIPSLKEALYRGEWWAPRRNNILRSAVAEALARIGTPSAQSVLDEAVATGSRGVRNAARRQLNSARSPVRERGEA